MAFVLNSDITIGPFVKVKVSRLTIAKSVFDFVNKATIYLPTSARLKLAEQINKDVIQVNKQFKEGDSVKIDLGYNGVLNNEFKGFISRMDFKSPLEVVCEGYSYILRKRTYRKTFKNVKLIEILKFLSAGTDIKVDDKNIADVVVTKLVLQDHSGTEALQLIKKTFNELIQIWFENETMYADLFPVRPIGQTVKYRIGYNIITANELKKRDSANTDVEVVYQARDNSGQIKTATGGRLKSSKIVATASTQTQGERKRINTTITDQGTLNKLANSNHNKLTYDGYEGKITAFLAPYCLPAWTIELDDPKFPERGGRYVVTGIEVKYGMGARRVLEIANKL